MTLVEGGDVVIAPRGVGGGDLDVTLQPGREAAREALVHGLVEGQLVGELGRAVVGDDLDVSGRDDLAVHGVVVDLVGAAGCGPDSAPRRDQLAWTWCSASWRTT